MRRLRSLWLGEVPLGEAFWTWGIGGGLAVNIVTSGMFLALISADRPWAALFAGYALSLPYNLLTVVGVWRAAARHDGDALHGDLARVAIVTVMLLLSIT